MATRTERLRRIKVRQNGPKQDIFTTPKKSDTIKVLKKDLEQAQKKLVEYERDGDAKKAERTRKIISDLTQAISRC